MAAWIIGISLAFAIGFAWVKTWDFWESALWTAIYTWTTIGFVSTVLMAMAVMLTKKVYDWLTDEMPRARG